MDGRKLSIAALNERRRRAVKMRLSGATIQQTAAQCELGRVTVIHATQAYERGGWKAVEVARPGRRPGSGRILTPEMEKQVQGLIRDRTPDQLKMNDALWTRQQSAS